MTQIRVQQQREEQLRQACQEADDIYVVVLAYSPISIAFLYLSRKMARLRRFTRQTDQKRRAKITAVVLERGDGGGRKSKDNGYVVLRKGGEEGRELLGTRSAGNYNASLPLSVSVSPSMSLLLSTCLCVTMSLFLWPLHKLICRKNMLIRAAMTVNAH